MSSQRDKSLLDQTRRSVRSKVSRESLRPAGVPVDLTPVVEGARRRFGKTGLIWMAVILLTVVTGLMLRRQEEPLSITGKPVAFLELARGEVAMLSEGGLRTEGRLMNLTSNTPLPVGAVIETSGATARAALRFEDGGSMRLDADSRVRFTSSSTVVLDRGAVYFDSEGRSGGAVEVRTTLGMVREIGTQFEVRLLQGENKKSLRVRVREGRIVLKHGQETESAEVGEELLLGEDGSLERRAVDRHGPHWNWVLEAAAAPQVEGLALQTFLDWFARQGGWTLRFTEPALAAEASTIILHGDVENLNAFEAATMVLGSSRMEYRLEGEVLVIEEKE